MHDSPEFLLQLVHDLRSQLRRIHIRAQKIERKCTGVPASDWEELREATAEQEELLSRTVRYAESGLDPVEWTSLRLLVRGFQLSLRDKVQATGGRLQVATLPDVEVPANLAMVFEELADNALKFRRDGEAPQISISGGVDGGCHMPVLLLSFADNGSGIPAAYRARVLEPFFRAHSKRIYPGTGLGLAICDRLLRTAGGSMEVGDHAGGGTCVSLRVPCR